MLSWGVLPFSTGKGYDSSSPGAAFVQQLQQSGLFRQLPQLMSAAAEELSAQTALLQQQGFGSRAAAAAGSSSFNTTAGVHVQSQTMYQQRIVYHSGALHKLMIHTMQSDNWTESALVRTAAAIGPAAARLTVAVVQHVSAHTPSLGLQVGMKAAAR